MMQQKLFNFHGYILVPPLLIIIFIYNLNTT